jgi:hypothetical protein
MLSTLTDLVNGTGVRLVLYALLVKESLVAVPLSLDFITCLKSRQPYFC